MTSSVKKTFDAPSFVDQWLNGSTKATANIHLGLVHYPRIINVETRLGMRPGLVHYNNVQVRSVNAFWGG